MCDLVAFGRVFKALTGHVPFPWQEELYRRFLGDKDGFPKQCAIPTGLGKTAVIPVWLIALANDPAEVPRRLVYIVNRRTVVDQATSEAKRLRDNLLKPELGMSADALRKLCAVAENSDDPPLAISTLRGQFADNGDWCADPARPAIVVGTIDMIGSRLLFSGYGIGRAKKPLHAGFLGQHSLIVHDEAHLEPAFQDLLVALQHEQSKGRTRDFRPLRIMELTATSRNASAADRLADPVSRTLELTDADRKHKVVKQRIEAKKALAFHFVDDEGTINEAISTRARKLAEQHPDSAILVYVRRVDDVEKIVKALPSDRTLQLTGTLRGKERDELVEKPVFQWFVPESNRKSDVELPVRPVFLVCTSAGEVGIDISADHMICDLTPFDSMAQRLGRVNRYGAGDAKIEVVCPKQFRRNDPLTPAREKTLALLKQLPQLANGAREPGVRRHDASPKALGELDSTQRHEAFTPKPLTLPTSDILFDAWALTTIREKLPGRPPVGPYLHGIAGWEPPETHVAWREEVEIIADGLLDVCRPEDLLDDYAIKPHELLRDSTDRVFKHLRKLAERHAQKPAWIVADDDSVRVSTLRQIAEEEKDDLNGKIVLLPPSVGGLQNGLLNGAAESADDVSDEWYADEGRTQKRRTRVWEADPDFDNKVRNMRLARPAIDTKPDAEEDESENAAGGRYWYWYELPKVAESEDTKTAKAPVRWQIHTQDVLRNIRRLVEKLPLDDEIKKALTVAAESHDAGKLRAVFQRSALGNWRYDPLQPATAWAKSGSRKRPRGPLDEYRHEFGSLLDVETSAEFQRLDNSGRDLVRHLIAAHHGRARPHFPADEAFDLESVDGQWNEASREVPRRFARLQRQYGRWGLAYLESLLRAADWAASANPSAFVEKLQEERL